MRRSNLRHGGHCSPIGEEIASHTPCPLHSSGGALGEALAMTMFRQMHL